MFVTNWISTTKIQKISEITNFFRHYFLSRTEVLFVISVSSVSHLMRLYGQPSPHTGSKRHTLHLSSSNGADAAEYRNNNYEADNIFF